MIVSYASKTVGGSPGEEKPVRRGRPADAGPAAAAGPPRPPGHPPRQALPGPATGHGHAAVLDAFEKTMFLFSFPFSAFPKILLKSCFRFQHIPISCQNLVSVFLVIFCFFLFFFPLFFLFFPLFF